MPSGNEKGRLSAADQSSPMEPSETVVELLRRRAAERPEGWAYSFLGDGETEQDRLTYGGLDRRARSIAVFLLTHLPPQASPGARVLLLLPSGAEFVASFFGCLYAGLIATPAYPPRSNRSLPRLLSIVQDSTPSVVLTTRTILERTREGLAGLPTLQTLQTLRDLAWLAVDDMEEACAEEWREPGLDGDSVAFLQYTSGSTSTPKGVVVTHGNLLHNQEAIRRAFDQSERSLIVGWLPLFHDMGLIGNVLQPLYVGAPCVLMPPVAFLQKPVRWLEAISHYRATTSGGPSFAYELCVEKIRGEQREGLDLSSWSVAFNGAEPVRAATLDRFAEAFRPQGFRRRAFYPCYGLAEATLFVSGGEPGAEPRVLPVASEALERGIALPVDPESADERRYDLVSCGRAPLGHEIRIVDPESRLEKTEAQVGEVWVAGPSVTRGYWGRPEETAATFQAWSAGGVGPFLRTGDLGFVQDGDLFVTGRLKDLVILRGRNHYPQDLELTAEQAHPSLRKGCGAAFSVDPGHAEDGGEQLVVVYEVDRHPAEPPEAIAQAVRREIAQTHEVAVREVVLVRPASIPKTSSGKIQRAACRSAYLEDGLQVIARSRAAASAMSEGDPASVAAGAVEVAGRAALEELPPSERRPALERWLRAATASVLRLAASDVPLDRSPAELGLDSLSAIELRQRIEAGLELQTGLNEVMEAPSLGSLAAALADRLEDPGPVLSLEIASAEEPPGSGGEQPLSLGQRALWIEEQMAPEAGAYNIAVAVRLLTPVEPEALHRAFEALAARHEMLRTAFFDVDGEPRQRAVAGPVDFEILRTEGDADGLARVLRDEAFRPFDLGAGRPLRARLIPTDEGPVLLISVHHLVADLRSLEILAGELAVLVEEGGAFPALTARFQDHVRRSELRLAGPRGAALEAYWMEALAGGVPLPALPTDRPRTGSSAGPGALSRQPLSADLSEALAALASHQATTPFAVLLAAFQALMFRYTGERDVWVGAPADVRTGDMAGVVGYFVNPVVMRAPILDVSFEAHLKDVRRAVIGALVHRDLPFPRLVERLQPGRLAGTTPLFQTLFVFERASRPELAGLPALAMGEPGVRIEFAPPSGWTVESVPLADPPAQRELTLEVAELRAGLSAAFHYRSDLFDAATAERLLGHFVNLLAAASARPGARLAELPLLGSGEREQIVVQWNAAPLVDREACLHELVFAQAERTPESVALVSNELEVTYRELCGRAAELAARLRRMGVGPETVVGICAERTPEMVAGVLAVLAAGGAYLPLDPAYPPDRLAALIEDSGARLVLTQAGPARRLPPPIPRLFLDAPPEAEGAVVTTGGPPGPGNLAYVIYTSGSTGRPKGVAIEHRNAAALVRWAHHAFTPDDLGCVLFGTSLSFDLSVFELFAPLACGGTVVLAENALALPSLPAAGRVRLLNGVPSAVAALAAGGDLGGVRTVCLAGEPLRRSLADQLYGLPGIERVFNLYGPTEDTTYSTAAAVSRGGAGEPSIGRPISGRRAYVLDPEGEPVPSGVPGELFLGGAGLARGYVGRPGLTAERFVPDAFGADPGGRLYRTGDLARYRQDGEIDFLGRIDHQVKVRGFRIEPGEIEARLLAHPDVAEAAVLAVVLAVVLARADDRGDLALVAYVAPVAGRTANEAALAAHLRAVLPEFMVPGLWVVLDRLPRTPNGKLDRRALPAPEGRAAGKEAERPRTPVEEILVSLWAEILGRQQVGIHDSFFDLGGHSLLAGRLLGKVRRIFEVDIPLSTVFAAPTPAGLAEAVEAARQAHPVDTRIAPPSLVQASREGLLPVSSAQRRLWFLQQFAPDSGAYNMAASVRLSGPLSVRVLEAGLGALIRRHEPLRTVFRAPEHQPVQEILGEVAWSLPRIDLTGLPDGWRGIEAGRLARDEAARPFDTGSVETAPLARFTLVRLGAGEHRLFVVLHHLIADGGSIGVLLDDLAALYGTAVGADGQPPALPPLPFQAADFAALEASGQWPSDSELDRQLAWWQARLAGSEPLALPTDRSARSEASPRGGARSLDFPAELSSALTGLTRSEGVTPFMLSLAGFAMLLHRYTGQEDFVIGVPISQRRRDEAERVVGLFVNTLALRLDLGAVRNVRELLGRVRRAVLEAFENQDLPFDRLVEGVRHGRQGSGEGEGPLVRVAFLTQDDPWPSPVAGGVRFDAAEIHNGGAKFDLILAVAPGRASVEYRTDLFDGVTLDRWLRHFAALLASSAANLESGLDQLSMLSEAERHHLLREHNDTAARREPELLHERIALHAAEHPDLPAVTDGELVLSYGELDRQAGRLARHLRSLGVGPEMRVGVCLERSAALVVSFLAVLKAGGVYLPLDPGQPAERLALMAEDARLRVMVTHSELVGRLAPATEITVLVDREEIEIAETGETEPALASDNLAYVLYTSGSTGRPKGVEIPHAGLGNLAAWHVDQYGLSPADRVGQVAAPGFDASVWEIASCLAAGSGLWIAPAEVRAAPADLARWMAEVGITASFVPTPVAERMLALADGPPAPARLLLTGGDRLRARPKAGAPFALVDHYGPTEGSVVATAGRVEPNGGETVPSIGRPIANLRVHVLGHETEPAPLGARGELCLGGVGLARGYLGRPDVTAFVFVPDPFAGLHEPGARLYRTGDLARRLADGRLQFLGRADDQVKVRGVRIELGEVEAALREHPGVADAVAAVRDLDSGERRLVAWFVPAGEPPVASGELAAWLRGRLPEAMVPSVLSPIPGIPLTPHGKVDRRALPALTELGADRGGVAPRSPLEEVLAGMIAEVLGIEQVGVFDRFFDLGGHSLTAAEVVGMVREAFAADLPLRAFFERPTVAGLAEALGPSPAERDRMEKTAALLLELADLSDDETEAMLVAHETERRPEGSS